MISFVVFGRVTDDNFCCVWRGYRRCVTMRINNIPECLSQELLQMGITWWHLVLISLDPLVM